MQKVVINGVQYVGVLVESEKNKKEMILKDAMQFRTILDRKTISDYFKRRNIGDLSDVTFGGKGVAYSISEMTKEEQMFVDMAGIIMDNAKSKALESVENTLFDSFLGK